MAFQLLPALLVSVGTAVVSYALQKAPPDAKNNGIQNPPVAEDGKVIPVIFGNAHITSVNCLWYGDLSTHEIKANGGK